MRIAIFGAGAVGGYFGGRLAQAGEEVVWLARGAMLEALRTQGLAVESLKGDFTLPPQRATDKPEEVGPVDVVILAVKTWQVPEAARTLKPWLHEGSLVLPLQNGVEAADQLIAELGTEPVAGGVAKIVAVVTAPGKIRHFGAEPGIELGPLSGGPNEHQSPTRRQRQHQRCERLHEALLRAGIAAVLRDDIEVALWEKFLFITSVSGVGAVHNATLGEVRSNPEARAQLEAAMREIQALAHARGISLGANVVERAMGFVDRLPAESTTSMQRDLLAGKPSELEAQSGAVVRLSQTSGVPAPVHSALYEALRR